MDMRTIFCNCAGQRENFEGPREVTLNAFLRESKPRIVQTSNAAYDKTAIGEMRCNNLFQCPSDVVARPQTNGKCPHISILRHRLMKCLLAAVSRNLQSSSLAITCSSLDGIVS